jgi:ABC-type uncharacterized transport system ATPase subunit
MAQREPHITVENLTMAYGDFIIQRDLTFTVNRGDNSVFLDPATKTMIAGRDPHILLTKCKDPTVHAFLTRGDS